MKRALVLILGLMLLLSGCAQKQSTAEQELQKAMASGKPTLVMFYATWCNPCKLEKPVIRQIEQEYQNRLNVVYIDVDKYPELSNRYGVRGTPTLMFFDSQGKLSRVYVGYTPKPTLIQTISTLVR